MNKKEIKSQLIGLKEHCQEMYEAEKRTGGCDSIWEKDVKALEEAIKAVEGQKEGRWIEREDEGEFYWECSECGQRINWVDDNDHYCCNCGTKMEVPDEG